MMKLLTRKIDRKTILVLLFIFLIGFIYRIVNLGTNLPGLYNDELYFILSAYSQVYNIKYLTVSNQSFLAIVYNIISLYIPSVLLFHVNTFSARFPIAIYGSLMVIPIYLLGNELFGNKKIALLSSLFWAISPSAVVTSRVGYGVEIFPLFIFLFAIYFWIKYLNSYKIKYLILVSSLIFIITIFSSTSVWDLIPLVGFILYTLFPKVRNKIILRKHKNISYIDYILAFVLIIVAVWIGLLYSSIIFSHLGYSGISGIPVGFLLVSKEFPHSLIDFFLRYGYALSPWKTFWLGEFSHTGLYYDSPVFVPFMMIFLAPFFYFSVFGIPLFYRKNLKIMHAYYLLVGVMLLCLMQPVFNITNPYYGFEPSEGIFALPFYSILTAFSFYYFLDWSYKTLRNRENNSSHNYIKNPVLLTWNSNKKTIVAILVATLLLFAGLNIASFTEDLFVSSNACYQDNNTSINYMYYGWNHVTDYLVENHLYNETIYYTPGKEGSNNLTNNNILNYWFYHQNFPLYWLYAFSDGKIQKIDLLHAGSLPPFPKNFSIVLSQNPRYTQLLSANGINNTILYTVYRTDGKPAIEVIQLKNEINASEKNDLLNYKLFYKTNIKKFEEFHSPSLQNVSSQITIQVEFSLKYGTLKSGEKYNLINSTTRTFSLGLWPSIYFHDAENGSFLPMGTIYSNFGNYSAPNTWQRIFDSIPIVYNTTYLLTVTFYNDCMYFYVNDTLQGTYLINYPLYPLSPPVFYVDSTINATIDYVGIWSKALNTWEIGYTFYNTL